MLPLPGCTSNFGIVLTVNGFDALAPFGSKTSDSAVAVFVSVTGPRRTRQLTFAKIWNDSVHVWNERADRKGQPRGRRSPHGSVIPRTAPHLALSGEIRPVPNGEERLKEAATHGFRRAIVPKANAPRSGRMGDMEILGVERLADALEAL